MVNLFTKTPRITGHSPFFSYQAFLSLLMLSFLLGALQNSAFSAGYDWQAQQRQQQMMQQQQMQQQMMRQQQMQQQQQMMQQRQMQMRQQQMQQQQAQQRQIQQQTQQRQMQQQQMTRQQQIRQQQQGSTGLRQNSANRGFPAKNQMPRVPNTPRIVIKSPQSTMGGLKRSTSLSSRAQQYKPTAADLAYKQKMKDRIAFIKKIKEESRLRNLEKERLDKEKNTKILNYEFNKRSYGVTIEEKDGNKIENWEKAAPNNGFFGLTSKTTIPQGTIIDRYGDGTGKFAAPYKMPLENRSLATGAERQSYSVYKVIKPLPALSGQAAPAFGKEGMGTQYQFDQSLDKLEKAGYIKKIN